MAFTDPIESDVLSTEKPSTTPSVTEVDGEDQSFTEFLSAEEETPSSEADVTKSKADVALEELGKAATALAEDDNIDNRMTFMWDVGETIDATEKVLEDADLESEEDRTELRDLSEDLDKTSDELTEKSEATDNEEVSDLIDEAAGIADDTGEIVGAIEEASATDPEKGSEMREEAIAGIREASEALKGDGTPLENLQAARQILSKTHTTVLDMFADIMGYAYVHSAVEAATGTPEEEAVQQRIVEDTARASQAEDDSAETHTSNTALTSGAMSAAAGVDLSGWKLTLPADHDGDGEADEIEEDALRDFKDSPNIVHNPDGSITFSTVSSSAATTANSAYPRSELREMLRAGDTSVDTSSSANNWVTSAASAEEQAAAGGVDGQMQATLSVDRVTEKGDAEQAGRVVIGQVHAENDEPVRLYFHQAPGSDKGSIYFAHEPQNGGSETFHVLLGNETGTSSEGIALGEAFTYNIDITGTDLTVSIETADGQSFSEVVDMSKSGYADEGTQMYFKAGVYSQNDSTPDPSTDFAEATYYSLSTSHNGETLGAGTNPGDVVNPGPADEPPSGSTDDDDPFAGDDEDPFAGSDDDPFGGGDEDPFIGGDDDPFGGSDDSTVDDSGGLSPDPSTDYARSDLNQTNLEERFINLYETLMEKQISFKERVEAFKTDNQNAGKG